jgi:SAM-dependent methyltransferase
MTETNLLTDRKFWQEYWKNYEYEKIPSKVPFKNFLPKLEGCNSFIEIGGFPGVFAAYFYKRGCKNVSLLDFYIDKNIINKFEEINDIPKNTVNYIESDFFKFETDTKYDIVFSYGFIEHFQDTKDVIQRHVELLEKEGKLLIILPNFRGLNGFIQYIFDRNTFYAHNLNSMKLSVLKRIVTDLGLKTVSVEYTRKPIVWLEPKAGNAFLRKLIKLFSYFLKLFPVKCRLLSPYIIIYSEKS